MDGPTKVFKKALTLFGERGTVYGSVEANFTRAASIASLWLDKPISARDVALILASVKMSRIAQTPDHADSFVDLCNYVAFGASLSNKTHPADDADNTVADALQKAISTVNGPGA
jgi:hypothetical protein